MPRSYAIVPAAGRSRRMGTPKLMLPWPTADRPDGLLIDQVLGAWKASVVDRIVVVVRQDDVALADACQKWDVDLLTPAAPPPDMTNSIQAGLQHVATEYHPGHNDGCFIAPSDLPNLKAQVIDGLWQAALCQLQPQQPGRSKLPGKSELSPELSPERESSARCVWTPKFGEQSGHPALLPWPACTGIFDLAQGCGVDSHVRSLTRHTVSFPPALANQDCDTPPAYQRALAEWKGIH